MIIDLWEKITRYRPLLPGVEKALIFLKKWEKLPPSEGKIEIDGDDFYCSVCRDILRSSEDVLWESHKKYADIHCVLAGKEKIGWYNRFDASAQIKEYDTAADLQLYRADLDGSFFQPTSRECVIFFPGEIHKAAVISNDAECEQPLRAIFKLRMDE